MEDGSLPSPLQIIVSLTKSPFPVSAPSFDGESQIKRCCKQVKMVRHQHVATDQPCVSFPPDRSQEFMRIFGCQPSSSVFGTNSNENDGFSMQIQIHSSGRLTAARQNWIAIHTLTKCYISVIDSSRINVPWAMQHFERRRDFVGLWIEFNRAPTFLNSPRTGDGGGGDYICSDRGMARGSTESRPTDVVLHQ